MELDATLGGLNAQRKITLSDLSHKDEILKQPSGSGWIKTPAGQIELRRISFLAELRNQVLKPLETLSSHGQQFDTIIFLNDVVFSVRSSRYLILENVLIQS